MGGWRDGRERLRLGLRCGGSSGAALHRQVGPIPLLDLGFNLKMFSAGGRPVHLAGSEGANFIPSDLRGARLLVLLHLASWPSLSSHQANYLDTRKALSHRWIFSPFPLACVCFLQGCLTPAGLASGPVPSTAGTWDPGPGELRPRCAQSQGPVWLSVYTDSHGGWGVPSSWGEVRKREEAPQHPADCISSGHN